MNVAAQDALPPEAITRLLRQSGYSASVVGAIGQLLDQDMGEETDPTLQSRAALAAEADDTLLEIHRALRGKTGEARLRSGVAALLRDAGLPSEQAQMFATLVAEADPAVLDLHRLLRGAGLGADERQRAGIAAMLEKAGASQDEAQQRAALATEADETLIGVHRALRGKTGEARLRSGVAALLRDAGLPSEQAQMFATLVAEADPMVLDLHRLLDNDDLGAEEKQRASIVALLEKGGTPRKEAQSRAALAAEADDTLLEIHRALRGKTGETRLRSGVAAFLRDAGAPQERAQMFANLVVEADPTVLDLHRLLRSTELGEEKQQRACITKLLERSGIPRAEAQRRATMAAEADDALLGLHRIWRNKELEPTWRLRASITSLLQSAGIDTQEARLRSRIATEVDPLVQKIYNIRRSPDPYQRQKASIALLMQDIGVEKGPSHDVAAALSRIQAEGNTREFGRIARGAQSIEDSCISIASVAWQNTPRFRAAYDEARSLAAWGRDINWRVQTLVKMAYLSKDKPGHFVECGVDTGGTARAVMAYLGDDAFQSRDFYLFDTFKGLVREQLTEEEKTTSLVTDSRYPDVLDTVRANFADKPFARIVPGPVPETLAAFPEDAQVAFLHIDMNVSLPEVAALRFFWPRLAPGAPVIFDDFGFPHHGPQRVILDKVAHELGSEIMMLPTCQGLMFKP